MNVLRDVRKKKSTMIDSCCHKAVVEKQKIHLEK